MYNCPYCEYTSERNDNVTRHMVIKHIENDKKNRNIENNNYDIIKNVAFTLNSSNASRISSNESPYITSSIVK